MHRARAILGTLLLVAGAAGLVIVPHAAPETTGGCVQQFDSVGGSACLQRVPEVHSGLPQGWYETAQVATWAALIVGGVLVLFALVHTWKRA